jgi:hypothetical protein
VLWVVFLGVLGPGLAHPSEADSWTASCPSFTVLQEPCEDLGTSEHSWGLSMAVSF